MMVQATMVQSTMNSASIARIAMFLVASIQKTSAAAGAISVFGLGSFEPTERCSQEGVLDEVEVTVGELVYSR